MILYPWPPEYSDATLNLSLEIAMDYLELTGQAYPYSETQERVANAILTAWRAGVRHKIRLANYGIGGIEKAEPEPIFASFYPRVS